MESVSLAEVSLARKMLFRYIAERQNQSDQWIFGNNVKMICLTIYNF